MRLSVSSLKGSLGNLRVPKSWKFWAIASVLVCVGVGGTSLALLFKLPSLPNCPSIFWPTASASLRLYCAQVAANKQTTTDLLAAIALVDSLPDDHPLRAEVNRNIADWSMAILDLGDQTFNQGDLEEAIQTARRIPSDTPAYKLVKDKIQNWQTIWGEAESIYQEAEDALREQDFPQAFRIAVRLLDVGNTYWETTKYQELNNNITVARQDAGKLGRARTLIEQGGLANLLEAVGLIDKIGENSYAYSTAQKLIREIGQTMLNLAESALDRRAYQEAINITRQIPRQANLQAEVQDFNTLAQAQSQSWGGNVADLESAIVQAQRIRSNRPLYSKAQALVSRWQLEIQDVGHLQTARQLAQVGSVDDLAAAIAEARLIPPGNPRADEARADIGRWTTEIETIEDRPYLDQAENLALGGDVAALQAAIDQASRIREGRALHGEARRLIRDWTARIQRTQDQPVLERARQFANVGDLASAIATAEQIGSGRALSDEAQTDVDSWRNQLQGQQFLQEAYQRAGVGSPRTLLSAIQLAQRVPASSPNRAEADQMINVWSQEILRFAQSQASFDLQGAIATANTIPPRTDVYDQAQLQIEGWQQILQSGEGN